MLYNLFLVFFDLFFSFFVFCLLVTVMLLMCYLNEVKIWSKVKYSGN